MIDKQVVKTNFSKYAKVYDRYSTVQDLCGSKLIKKIEAEKFNTILDIGCGTGSYTALLKKRFPKALVKAIDISGEMIKVSKDKFKGNDIEFIAADAEKIDFKETFDLISSNATFQWFENLELALKKYAQSLKKGGLILFSIFGPRTFYELARSLEIFSEQSLAITASEFLDKAKIEAVLKNIFSQVKIEEEIHKESYGSLKDLLKKIKYTGARGSSKQGFWTKSRMSAVQEIYLKNFKSITASYQIYFCRGNK